MSNTGVILEIRRERTVELALEGFRLWDIFRWKEGQQLTKEFEGCYFPGPGEYDMNGDGKADVLLYTNNQGEISKVQHSKLGKDIILTKQYIGEYTCPEQQLPSLGMKTETTCGYPSKRASADGGAC